MRIAFGKNCCKSIPTSLSTTSVEPCPTGTQHGSTDILMAFLRLVCSTEVRGQEARPGIAGRRVLGVLQPTRLDNRSLNVRVGSPSDRPGLAQNVGSWGIGGPQFRAAGLPNLASSRHRWASLAKCMFVQCGESTGIPDAPRLPRRQVVDRLELLRPARKTPPCRKVALVPCCRRGHPFLRH